MQKIKYLSLILLSVLLTACASSALKGSPDNNIAKNFHTPDHTKKILIVPPEVSYGELVEGAAIVKETLSIQIKRAGYQPVFLDEKKYKELWTEQVGIVGGVYDVQNGNFRLDAYRNALSGLAKKAVAADEYSLVLIPKFIMKKASFSGNYAVWDGVTRVQYDTAASPMSYSGTTTGLSIELIVLDSQGEWQATTFGGLLLPYQINIKKKARELRSDLFSDHDEVDEAIDLVLSPLFTVKQ